MVVSTNTDMHRVINIVSKRTLWVSVSKISLKRWRQKQTTKYHFSLFLHRPPKPKEEIAFAFQINHTLILQNQLYPPCIMNCNDSYVILTCWQKALM